MTWIQSTTCTRWPMALVAVLAVLAAAGRAPALDSAVTVSVYQGPAVEGDFPANLDAARHVVLEARERGVQFLVFPEAFLSGYATRADVERGARALDDPELQRFVAESAGHEVVILVGMARRARDGLYNSVLAVARGRVLGVYDKILLTHGDRHDLGFRPGTSVPVLSAHGARFAVLVCHDTSFPYVALSARLQGAEILFTPHNNAIAAADAQDHMRWVRNCHVGLACQLKVAVARANVVTTDLGGRVSYGGSFILSPQGEPLAEAKLFARGLTTATLTPAMFQAPHVWADLAETPAWLREQVADLLREHRRPRDDAELEYWLRSMIVEHRYSAAEVSSATGLTLDEVAAHAEGVRLRAAAAAAAAAETPVNILRVLPYPGGRHPRAGFLDGAVCPQRETKVSVFTPWDPASYVVADVPEAIFSNLGLLYLAHTHVPTLWTRAGVELPRLEWSRRADGSLDVERTLPNGVSFRAKVTPAAGAVRMELSLRNGTEETLSGLRVQCCVMLKAAPEFSAATGDNKLFSPPYAACRSSDGRRWVITAWDPLDRVWGNPPVPCIHSDPRFPDCAPGATVRLRGWLSFYEGAGIDSELRRIESTGWRTAG